MRCQKKSFINGNIQQMYNKTLTYHKLTRCDVTATTTFNSLCKSKHSVLQFHIAVVSNLTFTTVASEKNIESGAGVQLSQKVSESFIVITGFEDFDNVLFLMVTHHSWSRNIIHDHWIYQLGPSEMSTKIQHEKHPEYHTNIQPDLTNSEQECVKVCCFFFYIP